MSIEYSFIGVGNIARALLSAMSSLEGKLRSESSDIFLFDKNEEQTSLYKAQGYNVCQSLCECVERSDIIFLCVKPQNYREVLESIRGMKIDLSNKTFVSVAAGISTEKICKVIGSEVAVIRTMPNTPMTIGEVYALSAAIKASTQRYLREFAELSPLRPSFWCLTSQR